MHASKPNHSYPHPKTRASAKQLWRRSQKRLLQVIFPEWCRQCGILCRASETVVCQPCLLRGLEPSEEKGRLAAFRYRDPAAQKLICALKYRANRQAAEVLAPFVYEVFFDELVETGIAYNEADPDRGSDQHNSSKNFFLISVPLSKKRKRQRGYNQAQELARYIHECDGGRFLEYNHSLALKKVRENEPQNQIAGRARRRKNVKGCFKLVTPKAAVGQRIVLVDDVTTTGATFAEIETLLLEAGAKSVTCLAAAH